MKDYKTSQKGEANPHKQPSCVKEGQACGSKPGPKADIDPIPFGSPHGEAGTGPKATKSGKQNDFEGYHKY